MGRGKRSAAAVLAVSCLLAATPAAFAADECPVHRDVCAAAQQACYDPDPDVADDWQCMCTVEGTFGAAAGKPAACRALATPMAADECRECPRIPEIFAGMALLPEELVPLDGYALPSLSADQCATQCLATQLQDRRRCQAFTWHPAEAMNTNSAVTATNGACRRGVSCCELLHLRDGSSVGDDPSLVEARTLTQVVGVMHVVVPCSRREVAAAGGTSGNATGTNGVSTVSVCGSADDCVDPTAGEEVYGDWYCRGSQGAAGGGDGATAAAPSATNMQHHHEVSHVPTDIAVASAVLGLVGGSATAAAGGLRLAVLLSVCDPQDTANIENRNPDTAVGSPPAAHSDVGAPSHAATPLRPQPRSTDVYPWWLSPTQLSVASSRAMGAVVGNAAMVVGLALATRMLAVVLRWRAVGAGGGSGGAADVGLVPQPRAGDPLGYARFPSIPLLGFGTLLPGISLAAGELLMDVSQFGRFAVGFAGVAVSVLLVIYCFRVLRYVLPQHAALIVDPTVTNEWLIAVIGADEWMSLDIFACHVTRRWGSVLRAYRSDGRHFACYELLCTMVVAVVHSAHPRDMVQCGHKKVAAAGAVAVLLWLVLYVHPHRRRLPFCLYVMALVLQIVAGVTHAVAYYNGNPSHGLFEVGRVLFIASAGVLMILHATDAAALVYVRATRRAVRLLPLLRIAVTRISVPGDDISAEDLKESSLYCSLPRREPGGGAATISGRGVGQTPTTPPPLHALAGVVSVGSQPTTDGSFVELRTHTTSPAHADSRASNATVEHRMNMLLGGGPHVRSTEDLPDLVVPSLPPSTNASPRRCPIAAHAGLANPDLAGHLARRQQLGSGTFTPPPQARQPTATPTPGTPSPVQPPRQLPEHGAGAPQPATADSDDDDNDELDGTSGLGTSRIGIRRLHSPGLGQSMRRVQVTLRSPLGQHSVAGSGLDGSFSLGPGSPTQLQLTRNGSGGERRRPQPSQPVWGARRNVAGTAPRRDAREDSPNSSPLLRPVLAASASVPLGGTIGRMAPLRHCSPLLPRARDPLAVSYTRVESPADSMDGDL